MESRGGVPEILQIDIDRGLKGFDDNIIEDEDEHVFELETGMMVKLDTTTDQLYYILDLRYTMDERGKLEQQVLLLPQVIRNGQEYDTNRWETYTNPNGKTLNNIAREVAESEKKDTLLVLERIKKSNVHLLTRKTKLKKGIPILFHDDEDNRVKKYIIPSPEMTFEEAVGEGLKYKPTDNDIEMAQKLNWKLLDTEVPLDKNDVVYLRAVQAVLGDKTPPESGKVEIKGINYEVTWNNSVAKVGKVHTLVQEPSALETTLAKGTSVTITDSQKYKTTENMEFMNAVKKGLGHEPTENELETARQMNWMLLPEPVHVATLSQTQRVCRRR